MSVEIRVPEMGESIVDATVGSWLKHQGDTVQQGEALVELETDKVNVEVSAEKSGVLQQILKREGEVVAVGDVLGRIGEGVGENVEAGASTQQSQPAQVAQVATDGQKPSTEQRQPEQLTTDGQRPPSPLARRIAAEHNVDLSQVKGHSTGGRVTRDDVISYLEQNTQQPAASSSVAAPPQPVTSPQSPTSSAVAPTGVPVVHSPAPQAAPRGREERVRL